MIKVDLITGFLGSGKTTFLIDYARYLVAEGERVAVIVNDHGAINVDRLLLDEALGSSCRLEMVIGGDADCRRRRLKTKLIAMGMEKYTHVVIEPSGVFDVDEFFDMLFEEPLDHWYEIGNVLTIVDTGLNTDLSGAARYLLAAQLAKAGTVIFSKGESMSVEEMKGLLGYLNDTLSLFNCTRHISEKNIYIWKLGDISKEDYHRLSHSGYRSGEMVKLIMDGEDAFDSLFFFHVRVSEEKNGRNVTDEKRLETIIRNLFKDEKAGHLIRIKGFIKKVPDSEYSGWIEINATENNLSMKPIPVGQELFVVIGENLNKERIGEYWDYYSNEVSG